MLGEGGWQPIETAPRDGTWILLGWFLEHGGGGHPDVAFWSQSDGTWIGGGRRFRSSGYFSPTHWHALPPDPRETREKESSMSRDLREMEARGVPTGVQLQSAARSLLDLQEINRLRRNGRYEAGREAGIEEGRRLEQEELEQWQREFPDPETYR